MSMAVRKLLFVLLELWIINYVSTTEFQNMVPIKIISKDDISRHLQRGLYNPQYRNHQYEYQFEDPCSPVTNLCTPRANGTRFGCARRVLCDPRYNYRSSDGTCNNLYNPLWGASERPYNRFLAHAYEDGISAPRGNRREPPLPLPRIVSVTMSRSAISNSTKKASLMLMQWGQYIDHDMVLTPQSVDVGDRCCLDFRTLNTNNFCYQLDVRHDVFYQQHRVTCLPFIRSLYADEFCRCGQPREQINILTSYIDGSQIYGSSSAEEKNLRSFTDGMLKIGSGNEGGECPAVCPLSFLPERNNGFRRPEFFAGDSRVEEQPGLTSIHTLSVRFHNHLAQRLKAKNASLDDETLHQEARRIVVAVQQQITYGEFLPIILGNKSMTENNLYPGNASLNAYETRYNRTINASPANVFASAAFRFGHTLVKDIFDLNGTIVKLSESFNLHKRTLTEGTFPSNFLKGIVAAESEGLDHYVVETLTNKLFTGHPFAFGQDLVTLNIMRAREHGIPAYTEWRKFCNLPTVSNFTGLFNIMPQSIANSFAEIYKSVDDIDLFAAAIAETSQTDGLLGPTFACIIQKQFFNFKFGDRFWFESLYQPKIFTFDQLRSIHQTKLSTLLCEYTNAKQLQLETMKPVGPDNPLIPCTEILRKGVPQDIDLFW